jgi:hypothetical protein
LQLRFQKVLTFGCFLDAHSQYEGYVTDMTDLVHFGMQHNFALMQQLSAAVTSAALMTGSVFPNVTLPHFEITGGYVEGMGEIMAAGFAPFVKGEERRQWEEYAIQNQGWLVESARLKKVHPGHSDALHGTIQDHTHETESDESATISTISTRIFRWENGEKLVETSTRRATMYAPLWQMSPASAPIVNGM